MKIRRYYGSKSLITSILALAMNFAMAQASGLVLHYDCPAQFFEEALVIGNGRLGATVYGGMEVDR
ncbi:MAG: glycoside hydrolase N-terminal domain-containing protein, partial [Muribaculaceae bacterium]